MKAWWRAVRAEILKLKHTLALWMVLIAPLAVVILIVLEWMLVAPSKPSTLTPTEAWQGLGKMFFTLWSLLMLPLFVTLQTALLAGLEHGNTQWKHLLALPVPRSAHYLGKLTVALGMVVASYVLLFVLIVPAGFVLMFTAPHMGIVGMPHLGGLVAPVAASLGASLLIATLQTWIALRWRSFTLAVSAGMVATVAGFIIGQSQYGRFYPWTLPVQAFGKHGAYTSLALTLGLVGGLLVAVLGLVDFLRRESP
ncbi:MAG TPA: ABC transporter permease [Rhodanobacteraceae bacterium]|nr:ABC transporter permease [Rhodanobacteraceae bacterium]